MRQQKTIVSPSTKIPQMALIRTASLVFLLLLVLVAGGFFYGYQNQTLLLTTAIKQYLPEWGVEQIHYRGFELTRDQLSLESLHLTGQYGRAAYDGEVSSILIKFSWPELIKGKVQSVVVQTVRATITEENVDEPTTALGLVRLSNLLPTLNLSQLPLEQLEIGRWELDYRAGRHQHIAASGTALINDLLQVYLAASQDNVDISAKVWTAQENALPQALLTIKESDAPVAEIALRLLDASVNRWQWSVEGEFNYAPAVTLLRKIVPLISAMPDTVISDGLHLSGKTQLSLLVDHDDQLDFSRPFQQTLFDHVNFQGSTSNSIVQLDIPGISSDINGTLDVGITLRDGQLGITVLPFKLRGKLSLADLGVAASTLKTLQWDPLVPMSWINPATITGNGTRTGTWSLTLPDNQLTLGSGATELNAERLSLQASMSHRGTAQLTAQLDGRIASRLRRNQLPTMNISWAQKGSMDDSTLRLSVGDVAESMTLLVEGQTNLSTGQGQYNATLGSQDLAYASETLLPLMRKLQLLGPAQNLSIASGFVELSSALDSNSFAIEDFHQQARLVVGNLSGTLGEYRFERATLNASWTGIDQWRTQSPVSIAIEKLYMGFDILDTRLQLSLPRDTPIDHPLITIEHFSSTVFGGQVYLPKPQPWDFAANSNDFSLRAEGWQLSDMVALQQSEDIQAIGLLEGELPMTVTDGRVIIADGYLRALPPGGSIRYIANEASKALAASSTELALALDLLSDFQYEVLSSEVNLNNKGQLLLGLSLEGKNPSQQEGRAINFNINLEQNLDPLLQSLRLSDNLVKQLENQIN
jgi:hypothetical protein